MEELREIIDCVKHERSLYDVTHIFLKSDCEAPDVAFSTVPVSPTPGYSKKMGRGVVSVQLRLA